MLGVGVAAVTVGVGVEVMYVIFPFTLSGSAT